MNLNLFSERVLWIFQRASAVLNLAIIVYIFFSLNVSNLLDHSLTQLWLEQNFNKLILFSFRIRKAIQLPITTIDIKIHKTISELLELKI